MSNLFKKYSEGASQQICFTVIVNTYICLLSLIRFPRLFLNLPQQVSISLKGKLRFSHWKYNFPKLYSKKWNSARTEIFRSATSLQTEKQIYQKYFLVCYRYAILTDGVTPRGVQRKCKDLMEELLLLSPTATLCPTPTFLLQESGKKCPVMPHLGEKFQGRCSPLLSISSPWFVIMFDVHMSLVKSFNIAMINWYTKYSFSRS